MELKDDDVLYSGGNAAELDALHMHPPIGECDGDGDVYSGIYRQLVQFTGSGWELFKIWIVNFLLTVITFGIYHFWAKVKVRKYLWSHTVVEGEPLEYTGTAEELVIGFLMVAGVLAVYGIARFMLERAHLGLSVVAELALLPLWLFATYRTLRYRLTRTRWRGIRFNLSGSAWKYMFVALGQSLLNMLTLMLWYPKSRVVLRKRVIGNMWYGNRQFGFTGTARPLYATYMVALAGVVVLGAAGAIGSGVYKTFIEFMDNPTQATSKAYLSAMLICYGCLLLGGLFSYWYQAVLIRWEICNTRFPGVQFRSRITWGGLLWLHVSNLLLILCTLGFAAPWATIRSLRLYMHTVEVDGSLAYAHLEKDGQAAPKYGEGFFETFDVDLAM